MGGQQIEVSAGSHKPTLFHAFMAEEGGMRDYIGSFPSLEAVLEALPHEKFNIAPTLHVAYEAEGRLHTIDYVVMVDQMPGGRRSVLWCWRWPDGRTEAVDQLEQVWKPTLPLPKGMYSGGFLGGQWESDPL